MLSLPHYLTAGDLLRVSGLLAQQLVSLHGKLHKKWYIKSKTYNMVGTRGTHTSSDLRVQTKRAEHDSQNMQL